MRPGSVVVDLAVEQGGNVEGAMLGEVAERHGVRIVGHRNVPSRLAADSSALYARNIYNFLSAFWDQGGGPVVLPDDAEILKGVRADPGGGVVNEGCCHEPCLSIFGDCGPERNVGGHRACRPRRVRELSRSGTSSPPALDRARAQVAKGEPL